MECEKCGTKNNLTKHHVRSRRHYGGAKKSRDLVTLCRFHHSEIELLIPYEKQPYWFYQYILEWYIKYEVTWLIRHLRWRRKRKCR